ncbi:hypothetical protein [Chryseobacterium sp. T1]
MKKQFITFSLMICAIINAQVGINTSNPQNAFHIDGEKDNNNTGTPTAAQQANDFLVTSTGSVGIGTTSPTAKLEINNGTTVGAIKIVDGTQGTGKVLTSDNNGVGSWAAPGVENVTGVTTTTNTTYGTQGDKYMNSYINLPVGKWFVFIGFLVNGATEANQRYASRFTLYSSSTTAQQTDFSYINNNRFVLTQVSNGSAGAYLYGMFSSGIIRVDVKKPLTLYLWDVESRLHGNVSTTFIGNNGENYIFAIRAN